MAAEHVDGCPQHGLHDPPALVSELAATRAQNAQLRETVAAMRREMEGLVCRQRLAADTTQCAQHAPHGDPEAAEAGRAACGGGTPGPGSVEHAGDERVGRASAGLGWTVPRGAVGEKEELRAQRDPLEGEEGETGADDAAHGFRLCARAFVGDALPQTADAGVQVDVRRGDGGDAEPESLGGAFEREDEAARGADGGGGGGADADLEQAATGLACVRVELAGEAEARAAAEARLARLQEENERLMDVGGELRSRWDALTAQLPPAFVNAALRGEITAGACPGAAGEWGCEAEGLLDGAGSEEEADGAAWITGAEAGGVLPECGVVTGHGMWEHPQHAQHGAPGVLASLQGVLCAGLANASGVRLGWEEAADACEAGGAADGGERLSGGAERVAESGGLCAAPTVEMGDCAAGPGRADGAGDAVGLVKPEHKAAGFSRRGVAGGQGWGRGGGWGGQPRRPSSNSERTTPSQRARLHALTRRREVGGAAEGSGVAGGAHVPSITARNWNIKSDVDDGGGGG